MTTTQKNQKVSLGPDLPQEIWRPIPGHPKYDISDQGRVRSWIPWRGNAVPRVIKQWPRSDGRLIVTLNDIKPIRQHKVHVLLGSAFLGERPEGQQLRHLNGDHTDNRLINVAYGTPSENRQDQMLHGTHWQILKTHCPKNHPYSEHNTTINKHGHRICRECNRIACHTRYQKKRAALHV